MRRTGSRHLSISVRRSSRSSEPRRRCPLFLRLCARRRGRRTRVAKLHRRSSARRYNTARERTTPPVSTYVRRSAVPSRSDLSLLFFPPSDSPSLISASHCNAPFRIVTYGIHEPLSSRSSPLESRKMLDRKLLSNLILSARPLPGHCSEQQSSNEQRSKEASVKYKQNPVGSASFVYQYQRPEHFPQSACPARHRTPEQAFAERSVRSRTRTWKV